MVIYLKKLFMFLLCLILGLFIYTYKNNITEYILLDYVYKNDFNYDSSNEYKITDIKSSNTAVATPFTEGEKSGTTTLNVYPHKAGTAIISCRVNGKTYKTKFIARKYVCPLTYIKLGSTTMTANKFKKTDEIHLSYRKYAKKNQKISVKPAKGWKIKGIYCSNGTKYMTEVKNNSSYFINTENDWYMYVFFINPTTQQKEFINIYLD